VIFLFLKKIDGQEIGALDFNDVSHEKTDSAPFDWFDRSDGVKGVEASHKVLLGV
jgi:hypothetical protein